MLATASANSTNTWHSHSSHSFSIAELAEVSEWKRWNESRHQSRNGGKMSIQNLVNDEDDYRAAEFQQCSTSYKWNGQATTFGKREMNLPSPHLPPAKKARIPSPTLPFSVNYNVSSSFPPPLHPRDYPIQTTGTVPSIESSPSFLVSHLHGSSQSEGEDEEEAFNSSPLHFPMEPSPVPPTSSFFTLERELLRYQRTSKKECRYLTPYPIIKSSHPEWKASVRVELVMNGEETPKPDVAYIRSRFDTRPICPDGGTSPMQLQVMTSSKENLLRTEFRVKFIITYFPEEDGPPKEEIIFSNEFVVRARARSKKS
eukprot:TRINITY_DN3779_c0_g1_i2.p1 TRINITY_DN3779_c0_g1~~TRINITY_DN3779_c0_g1_i2.p1  ORF type:complete len:314 (+),score=100.39 TRINITY_DN3779_c0_g1_i2:156-1097(+)